MWGGGVGVGRSGCGEEWVWGVSGVGSKCGEGSG